LQTVVATPYVNAHVFISSLHVLITKLRHFYVHKALVTALFILYSQKQMISAQWNKMMKQIGIMELL